MTAPTTADGSDRHRSGHYDRPGLKLRLLQLLLHTDDPHQEALLGDLLEERAGGRSAFWFWIQVGYAAVLATVRDARVNTWHTVRAVLVGWLFAQGIGTVALLPLFAYVVPATLAGQPPAGTFETHLLWPAVGLYFIVLVAVGGGAWAVTRLNPAHEGPRLVAFLAATLLASAAAVASGLASGPLTVLSPALTLVFCLVALPMAIIAGGTLGRRVEVHWTA